MPRRDKSYALDQCALYRCGSKKKLLRLLQTTPTKLVELKAADALYYRMEKPKKNGGVRVVYAPRYDLTRDRGRGISVSGERGSLAISRFVQQSLEGVEFRDGLRQRQAAA